MEATLEDIAGEGTETSNRLVGRILKPIGSDYYYIWDGNNLYNAHRNDFKKTRHFDNARNGEYFSFIPNETIARKFFARKIKRYSKHDRQIPIPDDLIQRERILPLFFRDDLPVYLAEVSSYNRQNGNGEITPFRRERKALQVRYFEISGHVIDGDTLRQRQTVEFQLDPETSKVIYVRPMP